MIHETETEYQYARVIERPNGERTLELNEGQAIHSLYRPHSVLTGGYWDDQLVAPYAVGREPPRRVAILGFAGGTDGPRLRPLPPADPHRRRRDRRRAVRHRPPLLRRHAAPAAARAHRGRAPVPAPYGRPLRRDLRRRLPPALHPLLPLHPRVLRAGARPARPRRRGRRQRRAPAHRRPAGEGPLGHDGRRLRPRRPRPGAADEHAAVRVAAPDHARQPLRRGTRPPRRRCARSPCRPPAGSRRRCAAAPSTPTTRRRSSG